MLHIVHPYTFKAKGKTLMFGPIKEYRERDSKLSRLVKTALSYRYPVFVHERITGDISPLLEAASLKSDDLFAPLFSPRVKWIGTDEYGKPIHYSKPDDVSPEVWEHLLEKTVTHLQFVDLVGEPDEILVCGGEFSSCEGNFMDYIDGHFRKFDRRFYIPELSVVSSEDMHLKDETTADLKALGFNPVSYEEALGIVGPPAFSHSSQYNSQNQQ